MLRRLINWLLGIRPADQLEARRRLDGERERTATSAIAEAGRSNLADGKGSGSFPRDWTSFV